MDNISGTEGGATALFTETNRTSKKPR